MGTVERRGKGSECGRNLGRDLLLLPRPDRPTRESDERVRADSESSVPEPDCYDGPDLLNPLLGVRPAHHAPLRSALSFAKPVTSRLARLRPDARILRLVFRFTVCRVCHLNLRLGYSQAPVLSSRTIVLTPIVLTVL